MSLMDLRMPSLDGLQAMEAIRSRWPHIALVILTTYNEDALMVRGLQAGACGYLLKDTSRETVLDAIRSAARGETLLQPSSLPRSNTSGKFARHGPRQIAGRLEYALVSLLNNVVHVSVSPAQDNWESVKAPKIVKVVHGMHFTLKEKPFFALPYSSANGYVKSPRQGR